MECLICGDVIKHARMGVNACRACAAFFKRTDRKFGKLKCKDGGEKCRERNPKTTCRKCRLVRFREVTARASENVDVSEPCSSSLDRKSSFIDHTTFYDAQPSCSETPLLHRLRRGYSLMCLVRKAGEQALKGDRVGEGDVLKDNLTFTLASYSTVIPMTRVSRQAIVELANLAFEDFRSLDASMKKSIVESAFSLLNQIESTYRVSHHFPGDTNVRLSGYSTYIRPTDLESFFDSCKDDIDKLNLIRQFQSYLEQSRKIVREFFEIVKPSDFEFLALFGLALWNYETMNNDEIVLKLANKNRADIMKELHVYYARNGTVDYASRVGHIFCLLVNCQNHSEKTTEDFQVCRLMNLFQSDITKGLL